MAKKRKASKKRKKRNRWLLWRNWQMKQFAAKEVGPFMEEAEKNRFFERTRFGYHYFPLPGEFDTWI